jgi:hypothetical protein
MIHDKTKMLLINRARHAFKNHLVRKSYWMNLYECPVCGRQSWQSNNATAGKDKLCDGEKTSFKKLNDI